MSDLNTSNLVPQQQRVCGLKGAIESFEMFDNGGNCCGAALFRHGDIEGEPVFEVWFYDFNGSVPRLFRGSLNNCKLSMQLFYERKEAEGFSPMLADPPHNPIN